MLNIAADDLIGCYCYAIGTTKFRYNTLTHPNL